jgi:hypothetical protein
MGTLRLKHLVSEKIGENVGLFEPPSVASYLVKNQVEKWGAEVVEDTSQQRMKIRFVYVVGGKVTSPTSVDVVDCKEYSDDSVILNLCESSPTVATNYVGLVVPVAKLDTDICGRSTDFGFMWLPDDEKLPSDVRERFVSMVEDLKAIVIPPTQKKARRGSTPGSGDLPVSRGSTPGSTPGGTPERQRRAASRPPKTAKEATLEDLLRMQKSSRTDPKKLEIINQAIHNHLEPLYVWGCEPLDDADGRRVKVPLHRLHCAPATWVHRQVTMGRRQQLMDEVIALHGSRAKQPVFVMPIVFDNTLKEFKPFDLKPTLKEDMLDCDFWIIGGQHTIQAMKEVMAIPDLAAKQDMKTYCENHEIVVVWSLDKEKVMYMSKVLNLKIHDKDAKPTFFEDVTQGRAVWMDHNQPQPAKLGGIHSPEWNVSTILLNIIVRVLRYISIYREASRCL